MCESILFLNMQHFHLVTEPFIVFFFHHNITFFIVFIEQLTKSHCLSEKSKFKRLYVEFHAVGGIKIMWKYI